MRVFASLIILSMITPAIAQVDKTVSASSIYNRPTSKSEKEKERAALEAKKKRWCLMNPVTCKQQLGIPKK